MICHLLPRQSKPIKLNPTPKPFSAKPPVTENKNLTVELGLWAERSRQSNFEQSRRRNMATIQRLLDKKNALEPETIPPSTMTLTEPSLSKIENGEKPAEKVAIPEEAKSSSQPAVQPPFQEQPPPKSKTEHILPAGGSTSQREMVLMKLSKRIAAVEMNLTLSTEYLSELSKQ